MNTWSLFSDGSSLTPALRSLPGFSSIEAEGVVWLVHNPEDLRSHALEKKQGATVQRGSLPPPGTGLIAGASFPALTIY